MKLAGSVPVRSPSVARSAAMAVALSVALSVSLSAGCYETTPHRVEVAARVAAPDCTATIAGVFAGAGFVQLPSPTRMSMFFAPRGVGASRSGLGSIAGVSVTIADAAAVGGECRVTLEALSPDPSCPGGALSVGGRSALCDASSGAGVSSALPRCGSMPPMTCELTSAPGPDNDAAVDDLARRLRAALGPRSRVD